MERELFPEDIARLLRSLVVRLNKSNFEGDISLLGGAAMSMAYMENRRATTDIDAVFPQRELVLGLADQIGHDEDLDFGWFNDAVRVFIPKEATDIWVDLYKIGNVQVRVATAEYLLSMKLAADRGIRDRPDIQVLLPLCNVTTIEEAVEIFKKYHRGQDLKSETVEALIEMLKR
jgi:hypothetical protein